MNKVKLGPAFYLTMLTLTGIFMISATSLNENTYALEKVIKVEIETEQGNDCKEGTECVNDVFNHYCDLPTCFISFKSLPFSLTLPTTTSENTTPVNATLVNFP